MAEITLESKMKKIKLYAAASALILVIITGTAVFHYLERWSWISSFYFTVYTITTVGYGDLHPTREISRLITAIYILVGVATAIGALATLGDFFLERREKRLERRWERLRGEK
jgi:voltage-gated potassium channel